MASGKMQGPGVCKVLGERSKGRRGSAWAVGAAGRTRWKGGRCRASSFDLDVQEETHHWEQRSRERTGGQAPE